MKSFVYIGATVALAAFASASQPQARDSALRPRGSPLYNAEDIFADPQKAIDAAVKQTINQDVQFTLQQFANLPDYVSSVVRQAVKLPLSQAITNLSATEQLEQLSKQINDKLASVQAEVIEDISKLQAGVGDDTANFQALQTCIGEIVRQGGLQPGQSCLSESGLAIESITRQFNMFTEINDFQLPAQTINEATANITAYLDSVTLYPGAEAIISQTQGAIQNVQLAQAATERDAAQASFKCLINAIQVISTVPLSERYLQCDFGNTATTSFADSTLARVEQSYIQATNQYSGFLPPNIVKNVQSIGMQALSLSLDPYQNSTRQVINDAILSSVAATSGETATLALSLQKCLNAMLDLSTETTCDPERNLAIVQGNINIYNNYLSQFVSILPKELVLGLYQKTAELAAETDQDESEIRAQLDALFQQASAGTEYETCYRQFEDCLVEGIQAGVSAADTTCAKGSSCDGLVPQLTPDRPNGTSPYAGIAGRKRALAAAKRARRRLLLLKSSRKV